MPNLEAFEEKISSSVHPSQTAKEIARQIVIAALETEYGKAFTFNPNFAKMVDTLADMIVTNPDLRRQTLSIVSAFSKRDHQKS